LSKRCDWGDLGAKADATKAKAAHSQSKVFRSGGMCGMKKQRKKGTKAQAVVMC
jgi:hypothetical protein